MPETTEKAAPQIQLVAQEQTEGYCDPVSGVCVLPTAAPADGEGVPSSAGQETPR